MTSEIMGENLTGSGRGSDSMNRYLVCDITQKLMPHTSSIEWVSSSLDCLNKAIDEAPPIVVISFSGVSFREREVLLELIRTLKDNTHTRDCSILVLLNSRDRKLAKALLQLKVDFSRFIGDDKLDESELLTIINSLNPDHCLEDYLATVCPFLHNRRLESDHGRMVCSALDDRLMPGARKLHKTCETIGHLHCQYFLNGEADQ
jgi:hypothetical protein